VIAAVVIAVAVLGVLLAVWRSPHRFDLAAYGAFAVAVVALALGWIAWTWRAGNREPGSRTEGRGLDECADLLAEAVRRQWERAADERGLVAPEPIPVRWGRPALALAGSPAAAASTRRFDPLPGLSPARGKWLASGQIGDLYKVYGGLGSGRLVIAGPPGSGKSGAAVLLVLAALRHRAQVADADRPWVPVPILFTAHDWDPARQQVGDWLAARMRQTYPMFAERAAAEATALVGGGKIALILDGLDEVAEDLRPVALRALSQQTAFRVVVLSRTAEMATAASQQGVLEGAAAIELCAIDPSTAADYLARVQLDPPPEGWHDLLARVLSHQSPLARVLNNPLTLTLVRDTYRGGGDVRELLEFCDTQQQRVSGDRLAEAVTDHLPDRVLPTAYTPRPGEEPQPYDLQTAQRALTKIATRMNQDHTRDLQWWRFPQWVPAAPRVLVPGLVFGLVFGPLGGLLFGLIFGVGANTRRNPQKIPRKAVPGLVLPVSALEDPSTSALSPLTSWRVDMRYGLAGGLVLGLVGGVLVGGLLLRNWLLGGFLTGLIWLAKGQENAAWPSSLAAAQLALRWHTPVRLMRFLDDARERGVLRTVGPVYQFRHARLQDRLAEQDNAPH